jgi:hypothetical protein
MMAPRKAQDEFLDSYKKMEGTVGASAGMRALPLSWV